MARPDRVGMLRLRNMLARGQPLRFYTEVTALGRFDAAAGPAVAHEVYALMVGVERKHSNLAVGSGALPVSLS